MKKIFRKLNLQKYYEHIVFIICKLSGKQPPTLTRDLEADLVSEFIKMLVPYEKFKQNGDRSNFLSYSYYLHKQFQRRDLPEFQKYFPLLKSREKLRQQEAIYKQMCTYIGVHFIPSI